MHPNKCWRDTINVGDLFCTKLNSKGQSMKGEYWKSFAWGAVFIGMILAEADKCKFCNSKEATPGAALCSECFINELQVHLKTPMVKDFLKYTAMKPSADETIGLLQERILKASTMQDFRSIAEDIIMCFDLLLEGGYRIVAVPHRELHMARNELPLEMDNPNITLVKFALAEDGETDGRIFSLDKTWVYAITHDMGVERYEIHRALVGHFSDLKNVRELLDLFNRMIANKFPDNYGFYIDTNDRLMVLWL